MALPKLISKLARKASSSTQRDLDHSKIGIVLRKIMFAKGPRRSSTAYTHLADYKDLKCLVKNWRIPHKKDQVKLGAWHYLPCAVTREPESTDVSSDLSKSTLRNSDWPVVLFLHGLGSDRVTENYRRFGVALAKANVQSLHIDYRGYGDSSSCANPTEEGIIDDAATAFRWLVENGAAPTNVTVVGYSLGTGIAAALAEQLRLAGTVPRALVMISGYTSIADVITKYRPGGSLAIGKPLEWIPGLKSKTLEHLDTPLNTVGIIRNITCPILLVHARGDRDLDSSNSGKLFQVIMGEEKTPEQLKLDFRREEVGPQNYLATYLRREDKLRTKDKGWPIVSYLETEKGKHTEVVYHEETIRAIVNTIRSGWRQTCRD